MTFKVIEYVSILLKNLYKISLNQGLRLEQFYFAVFIMILCDFEVSWKRHGKRDAKIFNWSK